MPRLRCQNGARTPGCTDMFANSASRAHRFAILSHGLDCIVLKREPHDCDASPTGSLSNLGMAGVSHRTHTHARNPHAIDSYHSRQWDCQLHAGVTAYATGVRVERSVRSAACLSEEQASVIMVRVHCIFLRKVHPNGAASVSGAVQPFLIWRLLIWSPQRCSSDKVLTQSEGVRCLPSIA